MNNKKKSGLQNAPAEKRYKSFLNTVVDQESVWLLQAEDGYATFDVDGTIHLLVWPEQEFCDFIKEEGELPVAIEVHDFLEKCKAIDQSIKFMVFPTEKDSFVVTADQLCFDIEEHLAEVEQGQRGSSSVTEISY